MMNRGGLQRRSKRLQKILDEEVLVTLKDKGKTTSLKGELYRDENKYYIQGLYIPLRTVVNTDLDNKKIIVDLSYSRNGNKKRDENRYNRVNYGNRFGK